MGSCLAVKDNQNDPIIFSKSTLTFQELLGYGAFGKVWRATHKGNGKEYAIKVMSKNKIMAKKCIRSVVLQKKIHQYLSQERSELIVNMIASSQDRQKLYLVMQYIDGSNLRTHMLRGLALNQPQIKYLIYHLLRGLQFVHQKCVIHGDVKPQNIIIDQQGIPRIMDFGLSNCYSKENHYQTGGTLAYKTPEVLLQRNHTYCVDYYAVGIITYELFFKRRPHSQTGVAQLKKEIVSKHINSSTCPELSTISPEAADFIQSLLQINKEERLGYNSSSQIFEHPWLKTDALDHLLPDRAHYVQSFTHSRRKFRPTPETDSVEDNVEDVKNLLDREHIQSSFVVMVEKFEAFSQTLASYMSSSLASKFSLEEYLGQNISSLTSSQIRLQLRKTSQY